MLRPGSLACCLKCGLAMSRDMAQVLACHTGCFMHMYFLIRLMLGLYVSFRNDVISLLFSRLIRKLVYVGKLEDS